MPGGAGSSYKNLQQFVRAEVTGRVGSSSTDEVWSTRGRKIFSATTEQVLAAPVVVQKNRISLTGMSGDYGGEWEDEGKLARAAAMRKRRRITVML